MRTVYFDLETGGLDPSRHPITQIAAVAVDEDMKELDTFEAKLNFHIQDADPFALQSNNFDPELWKREARPCAAVCKDFSLFLGSFADVAMTSQRTQRPYFVAQLAGYNSDKFDGPFLQNFYKAQNAFLPAGFQVLCVLQRVRWHFHENPALTPPADFKLATVCSYFGIDLTNAHDALADVRATVALRRKLTAITLR